MRLAYFFENIHMSNGHDGLSEHLRKNKKRLKQGDCAIFINSRWTAVKLLTADQKFVIHYRHDDGVIARETIKHLPNCVEGKSLNYPKALEKALNDMGIK